MADFFDDQNNMEEDDDIITLYNEERDCDEDFYHLATLDVDDKWFVVMKCSSTRSATATTGTFSWR